MESGSKVRAKPPQVRVASGAPARSDSTGRAKTQSGVDGCEYLNRSGFTLVEMLIVLAVVALIAALSVGALLMAPRMARVKGTEATIAKIDAKLVQRLDEFNRKRGNIVPIAADTILAGSHPNRAQVIAVIRTMRQEFPDMFYLGTAPDGLNNDGDFNTSGLELIDELDESIVGPWNWIDVNLDGAYTAGDQAYNEVPPVAVAHRKYMERAFADPEGIRRGGAFIDYHRPATARAECLFMIVTAGGTDTSEFSADEMKDADGDGLMEFVDKFGNPIQFFLWPSYFTSPRQNPGAEIDPDDPHQLLTELSTPPAPNADWWLLKPLSSPFNYRRSFEHYFHPVTHFLPSLTSTEQPKGFKTSPLIVSAGPDEGFGLWTDPSFVGSDGVAGTMDDTGPIGWMRSVGPDGVVGTGDDGTPNVFGRPLRASAAMRILNPSIEGYAMDEDNIDNHHLRAK